MLFINASLDSVPTPNDGNTQEIEFRCPMHAGIVVNKTVVGGNESVFGDGMVVLPVKRRKVALCDLSHGAPTNALGSMNSRRCGSHSMFG